MGVAGDKKNGKLQLKYGSRLIKINDKRVENLSYQEIFEILQKTKTPITLQFKQFDELCSKWTEAAALKDDANTDYKNGNTESAIKKASNAIELHPTNKIYYSNRILMYLNCQQYNDALRDCQIIRELDPKSMYIKGHYLRGLTLLKLEKYKNAASAFQTVVKLNPSFKKATDRLNECLKELEKDSCVNEKRRSSQQQILKETFGAAQSSENVTDKKVENEKNENEKASIFEVDQNENVEQKEEEVESVNVAKENVVKTEAKSEEVEKVDSIQSEPVKVDVVENVDGDKQEENEQNVELEDNGPKVDDVQNENVNDDEKPLNVEAQSFEPQQQEATQ